MKSILIGSVGSSKAMLETMVEVGFPVTFVFSLDEESARDVSGYQPIHKIAAEHGIPYRKFQRINDKEHVEFIKEKILNQ